MNVPKQLPQFVETEPVASLAGLMSVLFNSTLTTAKMLDWIPLTWEELVYIAAWFNSLLVVFTYVQRSRVTPVAKANARIEEATQLPPDADPPFIK
jgi:hypothetical protein